MPFQGFTLPPMQTILPYFFGGGVVYVGLNSICFPRNEYARAHMLLEGIATANGNPESTSGGTVSPMTFLKGTRDLGFGLALLALQYQGNEAAVTTMMCALSLFALGDGTTVWMCSGPQLRVRAFQHWMMCPVILSCALWRLR